ncbi:amidase family protein [Mesorhizobium sp. WSM1293]|uniref:amidase family protein n=1 Tax=Mesorhizobium sp. WSM1293 TaxID=1040984 RepID=UPI002477F7F3|nr:amidase family protein [Mesorhizobium sp. WSM1293]
MGRTTTPERGIGSSESVLCGITRNPWNLDRTTGGSTAAPRRLSLQGSSRSPAAATARFVCPHRFAASWV